ncbi:MAG: hypothetical protein COB16_03010 [Rhodobacteraceae bacterium]|nr:MAG: hypothetical protein COB16_03010 [Paracoccaceae bacterium]
MIFTKQSSFIAKALGRMQALELATLRWVDCFKNRRLLGPIGNIPSVEAEENYYALRAALDRAA